MYRALAGQLRQLLCRSCWGRRHFPPLAAVYPKLRVKQVATDRVVRVERGLPRIAAIARRSGASGINAESRLPSSRNGLAVADLLCDNDTLIPISEWIEERRNRAPSSTQSQNL